MSNRTRTKEIKLFLSDDERYILEEKWKASEMKSRSAFLRHLIIYGFVYDVDYKDLNSSSNCIAINSLNYTLSYALPVISNVSGSTWQARNHTSTPAPFASSIASPNSGCVPIFGRTSVTPSICITKARIA